jgi:hypothetical protein
MMTGRYQVLKKICVNWRSSCYRYIYIMINEVTGKAKEIVDIEKVQIIFLDLDDKFKK